MKLCLAMAALAAGCVINTQVRSAVQTDGETLRARAAFDFRCSKDQLVVTEIDNLTAGVEGCGQRGTYVFTSRTWVLNSPNSGQEPITQPPPDRQPLLPKPPAWQQQSSPPPQVPGAPPGPR